MATVVRFRDFAELEAQRICLAVSRGRMIGPTGTAKRIIALFRAGGDKERAVASLIDIACAMRENCPFMASQVIGAGLEEIPGSDALYVYAAALRQVLARRSENERRGKLLFNRLYNIVAQDTFQDFYWARVEFLKCVRAFMDAGFRMDAIDAAIRIADKMEQNGKGMQAIAFLGSVPPEIEDAPKLLARITRYYTTLSRRSQMKVVQ